MHVYVCARTHAHMHCEWLPPSPLLTNYSGIILTPNDWLNNFYSCYTAAIVSLLIGVALALMHIIETEVEANPITL